MFTAALGVLLGLATASEPAAPGVRKMPSGLLVECEDFKLGGKWRTGDKKYAGFSGKAYVTETAAPGKVPSLTSLSSQSLAGRRDRSRGRTIRGRAQQAPLQTNIQRGSE